MPVCVYAIVPASVRWSRTWRGLQGEPLKLVRCGDAAVLIGIVKKVPNPNKTHLERYDALMRRIVAVMPAVLPARFGLVVRDIDRLHALTDASGVSFRKALRLVTRREQMTLRVSLGEKPHRLRRTQPPPTLTDGPGRRYLTARLLRARIPQDRALRALRRQLAPLVRSERFHLKDAGVATLYHLIERGQSAAYLGIVRAFSNHHPGVRLRASGPFPPYAFAPRLDLAGD